MFQRQLLLILSLSMLVACSGSPPVTQETKAPNADHGKTIYKQQCVGCHDAGRSAPSLREPEEWDIQQLETPDILRRHQSMRMPSGFAAPSRLSAQDEKDVLYFVKTVIEEAELKY